MQSAIESVFSQTRDDFELVIVDSGRGPYSQHNYDLFGKHPKVIWQWTEEPEDFKEEVCPVSWVFNRTYKEGLFKGRFFCCHYDDDLYHPNFLEKMAGHLEQNPSVNSVRCTQDRVSYLSDGTRRVDGQLIADKILTINDQFSCQVDGMQVMFRTDILSKLSQKWNEKIMEEHPYHCGVSDGEFLERAKHFAPEMHFINESLCEHRFTVDSIYNPSEGEPWRIKGT